jgi:hypothetical protein
MAVLVEAITVVVRRDTLERVYAGGVDGYELDCPNATFCTDDDLTSVGFMTSTDVRAFVERLVDAGLGFVDDQGFVDIAAACGWLAFSRLPGNYSMCWLLGADPDELAIPASRHPETLGTMRFVPLREAETQLEHLESDDERGLATYRDRGTGEVFYVGRAFSYADQASARASRRGARSLAAGLVARTWNWLQREAWNAPGAQMPQANGMPPPLPSWYGKRSRKEDRR